MSYSNTPRKETLRSLADASHMPFWLDDPSRPAPEPELKGDLKTDLLVIGAGFTGLWTALLAKEADPSREVLMLEAGKVAIGASGRNGGFMDASITHGFLNGLSRWPKELPPLIALGLANLDEIESTINRLGIECDYRRTGDIDMATEPYQVQEMKEELEIAAPYRTNFQLLDREQVRAIVKSPIFIADSNDLTAR